MTILQEIKDQVAREDNYSEWEVVGELGVSDWHIEEIAKRFAKEVAKQALINASENARLKLRDDWLDLHEFDCCECIDKQSILNESNIPEL